MRVRTSRWLRGAGALGLTVIACMTSAGVAAAGTQFRPGAPGIGDPYFPRDGNGGYDVKHYFLDLQYNPRTDVLRGQATIRARATQNLSRFNLDFVGLTVDGIRVNGCAASWTRNGHELVVTPCHGLRTRNEFIVVVRYHGVPQPIVDDQLGISGFIATNDGAVIAGQPHGAATWFPANDHPLDKASYTFRVKVPAGLEVVANGGLRNKWTRNGWTTWRWDAGKPMASYLATATMGQFNLRAYERGGIRFWDAIDPALFAVPEPRTGEQYAISQKGEPSYKRLARTIAVPAGGASLSFWINRDTEPEWDFVFVEARTVGQNDWTTLRDLNGHTSQNTGASCPYWHGLHPFLRHYQTDNGDDTCSPRGSTGRWWAASGASDGWERWRVDLSAYAGSTVRVSISYASDDLVQLPGAFVDDIVVSNGPGTTSFEDDGNTMDGWQVPGAPAGSAPNPNDWIAGTSADTPPTLGEKAREGVSREVEITEFLEGIFGRYPFSSSGSIIDDVDNVGFALENQTRPTYSKVFFEIRSEPADSVFVHELAHQWVGDSLAVARWQHIWLNEGFATYAEWLWSEREGRGTAQQLFDFYTQVQWPAGDPFWTLVLGDPGPVLLFELPVYYRGAMTLHVLRGEIGDEAFFRLLREWIRQNRGGHVTTPQFIALAERISGQQLDDLFETWLFTGERPPELDAAASSLRSRSAVGARFLWDPHRGLSRVG